MPALSFLARLGALLILGMGAASAQADYRIYVDTDADASTGCSVTLAGSGVTIDGMESRLTATSDAATGTEIVDVTRETCSGSGFGGAVSVGGGYPVGLGLGVSGADVVELADSLSSLGATGGAVRLAFTAEASGGDDALVQADGGGAILATPPQTASLPIPGLGLIGMLFLIGALGLAGWVILRRGPGAGWMIVGMIVVGTAWAAHRMADGNPGDWTGGPLATDAQFDALPVVDILAGFVAFEDGRLYARIDVDDVAGNAAPTADATSAAVDEDAGPVTVNLSGSDPEGDPLTFGIATGPGLGTLGAVTSTGTTTATVDYTPDPDANGSDSFTYTADDGTTTSTPATASITVNPVNDNPDAVDDAFTVDEDSSGNSLDVLANDTDAPDSGETLIITGVGTPDQGGSVSITGGGTGLSYTPAADFAGTETFNYTIGDGNGGADTATVTVTVTEVNEPPTVTDIPDQTIPEDDTTGPLAFTVGDAESAAGALTVTASSSNQTLVPDGNLTLGGSGANRTINATPAADQNAMTDITVTVEDPDGATASTTFQLTVNPVNDPPQVTAPGPFNVTGNVRIQVTDGPDDLLAGANDAADGGTALSVTAGSIASSQNGDVTLNGDGTFSYDPPAGYEGADSFNFEVCDSGVPGSECTTATVDLNVSDMVWFVDPAASAGDGRLTSPFNDVDALDAVNDGTGNNPAAGDDIFLYTGTHDGQLTLLNSQRVFGQGATATLASLTGITQPPYSDPLPATGGTRPNWTATNSTALTVGEDNTLRGFDMGNTGTGTDIAGSSFGTLTVSDLDLLGSGQALDLNTGTLVGTIGTLTSTSGSRNVSLVSMAGTPTLGGGSLSGAANQAFFVDGGTGTFSYPGSIANTNDRVVQIQNKTSGGVTLSGNLTSNSGGTGILVTGNSGGTYTFSGGTKTVNTGTNSGVTLSSNTGATVNFTNGGLDIDATSGSGFSATGGGTVNVAGSGNTVDTTTGTGVNIVATDIGGDGVEFQSVSSDGGANPGIVLNGTGTAGGLTVSGDGVSNGSGGAIVNKSGDAIYLESTTDVALGYMNIGQSGSLSNIQDNGIRAHLVDGFTLNHSNLRNIANENSPDEAALFATDPRGVWNVTNSLFDRSYDDHIRIENSTTTSGFTFNLLASTLSDNNASGNGNDSLLYVADGGNTDAMLVIQQNTFDDSDGDHIQVALNGTASADVTIGGPDPADGNTLTATTGTVLGSGITLSSGADSSANGFQGLLTYLIQNNDIQDPEAAGINVNLSTSSTAGQRYSGSILDNVIGTSGDAGSGGFGIQVTTNGAGTSTALIEGNSVRSWDGANALRLTARDGSNRLNATVRDNVFLEPDPVSGDTEAAVEVASGAAGGDTTVICLDITDADVDGDGNNDFDVPTDPQFGDMFFGTVQSGTSVLLAGYGGSDSNQLQIESFVQAGNVGSPTVNLFVSGGPVSGAATNACQ